jgi:uncharacterized protein YcgI (DUF1989 family)
MNTACVIDEVVAAGEPWMGVVRRGQVLRIVDLEGNQAVDTLFYNAADTAEAYSAQNTIQAQQRIYLTTGTVLLSNRGNPMLRIEDDTCGRHDTLGGACSSESNTVRYNINVFLNGPVTPEGQLRFADGISAAGRHVQMSALMDTLVLISNCPQLNNPCNAYNPTPIRVMTWDRA